MKARGKLLLCGIVTVALVLSLGATAFAASTDSGTASAATGTTVSLSTHVQNHLILLREEEKLARDVFAVMYAKWNVQTFHTIGAAENRHMASVKVILDRYGIADPVGTNPPGVFTNPKVQQKYAELVAQGSKSLTDAYKVGIAIEKAQIALLADILGDTVRPDVTTMARNLLNASYNHLSVFAYLLTR